MKQASKYPNVFNPAAATIAFGIPSFRLEFLLAVINVTGGNKAIYAAGSSTIGSVAAGTSGAVVQLQAATQFMAATDKLLVLYDFVGQQAADASVPVVISTHQTTMDGKHVLTASPLSEDLMKEFLHELKLTNVLLAQGLNITDDLNALRSDVLLSNT